METFTMMECADGSARATPDEIQMLTDLYRLGEVRRDNPLGNWITIVRVMVWDTRYVTPYDATK